MVTIHTSSNSLSSESSCKNLIMMLNFIKIKWLRRGILNWFLTYFNPVLKHTQLTRDQWWGVCACGFVGFLFSLSSSWFYWTPTSLDGLWKERL